MTRNELDGIKRLSCFIILDIFWICLGMIVRVSALVIVCCQCVYTSLIVNYSLHATIINFS